MSNEDLKHLTKHIDELVKNANTATSEEAIKLFKEIKVDIKDIKGDMNKLETAVDKLEKIYTKDILPNVKSWNKVTTNYDDDKKWLTRLIGGILLTAIMGLILAKNIGI